MTPDQLKAARIAAGLSPMQAASLVHVDKRTWQRYEAGDTQIPGAIVELFKIKTRPGGMTTAFLSSPYSHPSATVRQDRARAAGDACAWLWQRGWLPVSPIAHWHEASIRNRLPDNALAWADWNRQWLERSSICIVLMLDGWRDSTGVAMGVRWATDAYIPVRYIEPQAGGFAWVGKSPIAPDG